MPIPRTSIKPSTSKWNEPVCGKEAPAVNEKTRMIELMDKIHEIEIDLNQGNSKLDVILQRLRGPIPQETSEPKFPEFDLVNGEISALETLSVKLAIQRDNLHKMLNELSELI